MPITNEDLLEYLSDMKHQLNEIQSQISAVGYSLDEYEPTPAPFAVTPVGKLNEDGSITLPDGTKQFPYTPAANPIGDSSIPNTTPSLPPGFVLGALVFLKHDPYRRIIPIIHVGDGLVRVALTDELRSWLNASDHQGAFYPSALSLA